MPQDLPGLYWDEEKKRYYPLASRPAWSAPIRTASDTTLPQSSYQQRTSGRRQRSPHRNRSDSPPSKRQHSWDVTQNLHLDGWRSLNALKESSLGTHRQRCLHEMQMDTLTKSMSRVDDIPIRFDGPIMAICAKISGDDRRILVGDNTGWLYSVNTDDLVPAIREFGLRTQITSITRSGQVCMVTSLGSPARLLVTRDDSIGLWVLREIPPQVCNDVWCGQVWDRRAILGGRKASLCFPDVERDEYIRLTRSSDVLSLSLQNKDIAYAGMRSGIVDRWDSRQPGGKTDVIVNMSETGHGSRRVAASVDHLRILHEYELLVKTMRGDLETHDLRFLRSNDPILRFEGHVPSYESRLGITVDPSETFVFVGGGDCHLRIWSLRTGQHLPWRNEDILPFTLEGTVAKPSQPIRAMEIVEDESGAWLWVAVNNDLDRIHLGSRGLLS